MMNIFLANFLLFATDCMTVYTHYSLQFHPVCACVCVCVYVYIWIILISSNCYEELNRNFNKVLSNPLGWFQANQLVLNME